jgi:conjugative transfer signal peptidase TraF
MSPAHLAATAGAVLLAFLAHPASTPVMAWNASASAPLGLYLVRKPADLNRGDFVLASLPPASATMAARRGYLPQGVPVLKRIAALAGDEICSSGDAIRIDGSRVATRLAVDKEGRPLPSWSGCLRLDGTKVLLLMAMVPDSFDGRYFGPIQRSAIIGKATPLWTW